MSEPKSKNITWHGADVTQAQREEALGQKGAVVWLTGLSASGKSTIARRTEQKLLERGVHCYVLDGDNLRMGLNKDLGFSPSDRTENIRRVGCVAQLFADAGILVLTAFISPYRSDRDNAREHVSAGRFVEVHVSTPLEACEARDPKGLYKKARAGNLPEFTGISAPYEVPERAEITLDNSKESVDESADRLIRELNRLGFAHA